MPLPAPSPSSPDLEALREVLAGYFGLVQTPDLKTLLQSPPASAPPSETRRFLIRSSPSSPVILRVAQRLDVHADTVVVDPRLGTLGIVHFLPVANPSGDTSSKDPSRTVESICKTIARRIGEAAYLRHLLLEELRPGEPQYGRTPYSVEIVFILPDASLSASLGAELRSIMREIALLHAIGVSLLEGIPAASDPNRASKLTRGFSWLLHHTREWLRTQIPAAANPKPSTASQEAASPKSNAPFPIYGPPAEVALENFRLGGTRRWLLAEGRMLHLVHGPNGSGKSSLVEALELVTTGCIDRIAAEDHRAILTNRRVQNDAPTANPKPAARVDLRFAKPIPSTPPAPTTDTLTWQVEAAGVAHPLTPKNALKPGAFRLNQEIVDILAQSDSKARAQLLLTFFPDSYDFLTQSRQLLTERGEGLKKLPARIRASLENATGVYDESRAESALAWVQDTSIPFDRIPAFLPLDSSQISTLLPLLPLTFESNYRRTGTATSWEPVFESARQIDGDLRKLMEKSTQLTNCLHSATAFLNAYRNAAAVAAATPAVNRQETFPRWLDLLAATDILQREHDLLAALEQFQPDAAPETREFPEHVAPVLSQTRSLATFPDAASRLKHLEDLRKKRDDAQRLVAHRAPSEDLPASDTNLPPLSTFDLGALDALANAGAFGRDFIGAQPLLSQAVRSAFHEGKAVPLVQGDRVLLQIGESGSFSQLAQRLERVTTALQTLESARSELTSPESGVAGILQQFRSLRRIADQLAVIKNQAAAEFTHRLETPLGAALNEFTAMLTPARWAYDDIVSRVDASSAEPSFGFVQRGAGDTTVPAPLRLNTAQISAFALSFFLLCHRARQHPLRLGILDDPFENMDELTVTAVARGLGRYLRLRAQLGDGPESWQLILFLHGEQNVDRVRREIPCATYLLPWLSPDAQLGMEGEIRSERSEFLSDTLQDLNPILEPP